MPVFLIAPFGGDAIIAAAHAVGATGIIVWPDDWFSLANRLLTPAD